MKKIFSTTICYITALVVLFGQDAHMIDFGQIKLVPMPNGFAAIENAIEQNAQAIQRNQSNIFKLTPAFRVIQFEKKPTAAQRVSLAQRGIELVNFIDGFAFLARINAVQFDKNRNAINIRASFDLPTEVKISQSVNAKLFEDAKVQTFLLHFAPDQSVEEMLQFIEAQQLNISDTSTLNYSFAEVQESADRLQQIMSHSNVVYLDLAMPDQPVRYEGRTHARANGLINPNLRNLHGADVVIGIGDGGRIHAHKDFGSRINSFASGGFSTHATNVTSIIGAHDNINPYFGAGVAHDATLISNNYSDILRNTEEYIRDYEMVLTNNSYGSTLGSCIAFGDYNSLSQWVDGHMNTYPQLLHIFAAGNDGNKNCAPYAQGFGTVAGGYQVGKNVLTVGSSRQDDEFSSFSAQGPTHDGRIKPEVVAQGHSIQNAHITTQFRTGSGTSFSSPMATGVAAVLYEHYRNLNGGQDIEGALLKAIMCNTADDMGNVGPDYRWGYGRLNAIKAAEVIDENYFFTDDIADANTNTHTINVPAGLDKLKVMLLWNDPEAVPYTAYSLINDLDLKVTDPSLDEHLPWTLNPAFGNTNDLAQRGEDHANNIEQITIDNPAAGTYELDVQAFDIAMGGSQHYHIVYYFEKDEITLTYPINGEKWAANKREYVRWDAPATSNLFTLEYSLNNGTDWLLLDDTIPANDRLFRWNLPDTFSSEFLVRISENGTSKMDVAEAPLTFVGRPQNLEAVDKCAHAATFKWDGVSGASSYRVYQFTDYRIKPFATVTDTFLHIQNLHPDTVYWWSVSSLLPDGSEGMRQYAISSGDLSGDCTEENDVALAEIISPKNGRILTSTSLTNSETITVEISNRDDAALSDIPIRYQVNGGPINSELITGPIDANATDTFSFINSVDLSGSGTYDLQVWIAYPGDMNQGNDTLFTNVKHLTNPPITLPFTEDFESVVNFKQIESQLGAETIDALDLVSNGIRIRSFAGGDFPSEGSRALTIDAEKYNTNGNGSAIFNYNFSAYDIVSNDVRFNFDWRHHESTPDATSWNKMYIRGNDQNTWIEAFDFVDQYGDAGLLMTENLGIGVSALLDDNGQNFSSSFQLKIDFEGKFTADELHQQDGLTIDNLEFYEVGNDLQLLGLSAASCQVCMSGDQYISLQIKNASDQIYTDVPIGYQFEGFAAQTDVFNIGPGETKDVILSSPTTIVVSGQYLLSAWIHEASDTYLLNDSLLDQVILILNRENDFPYLETFEANEGGFVSGGEKSSWQRAKPVFGFLSKAAEDEFAWVTNPTGSYNANELSYLYSPRFIIAEMTIPSLSFAMKYFTEDNFDYVWIEYSEDGQTYTKLGSVGEGLGWYNDANTQSWDNANAGWRSTQIDIPSGLDSVQFRWVLDSDGGLEREGVAIDQVHVYDRINIYEGDNTVATNMISGMNWSQLTADDFMVAEINPNAQNLGSVDLRAYIDTNEIIDDGRRYLLGRHWTIDAANSFADSVGVRLYVTEGEMDKFLDADQCDNCVSHADGFDLTVYQYTGAHVDSLWTNNEEENISFYDEKNVHWVPYAQGYYAEFWVTEFSEFWIGSADIPLEDTICISLSNGSDDAEEVVATGSVNPFGLKLNLGEVDFARVNGLVFRDINVPKNSFVNSAYLQFTSAGINSTPTEISITTFDVPNVGVFNTSSFGISTRAKYAEAVQWSVPSWSMTDVAGPAQRSPDLKFQLQHVLSHPNWTPGSRLGFYLTGSGGRQVHAFENGSETATKLVISYTDSCVLDGRIYVDAQAPNGQAGDSWANAVNSLHDALTLASACTEVNEIWVKSGTYLTSSFADPTNSFKPIKSLKIYGGFVGTESTLAERNLIINNSILDGELGELADTTDNARHVITVTNEVDSIYIDGFHIKNGVANLANIFDDRGGGVLNYGTLHLKNCIFENHKSLNPGTTIYNVLNGGLTIEDCIIKAKTMEEVSLINSFGGMIDFIGENFFEVEN